MAENLYTVQKTYEALVSPDTDAGKKLTFDDSRIFKNEVARQMYLVSLKGVDLQSAIVWLEKEENKGVQDAVKMLELLKSKQNDLANIQVTTRKLLEQEKFVINALIPKAEKAPAPTPTVPTPTVTQKVSPTPVAASVATPVIKRVKEGKEPVISEPQFTDIENMLSSKKGKPKSSVIQKNAAVIVTALKSGTNLSAIKEAVASLTDTTQTGLDFQEAIGMTPDGGVIGPKTILAFLRKAGVAEKDIPEVIKDAAAKPATLTTPAAKPTPAVVPPATEKAETQKNPKLTLDKDDRIMNGTKLFNGTIDSKNPLDVGDGATYSGEVKDGKFEGKGKFTFKSGNTYEGDFKNDKFEGKGKFTYKNGDVYVGNFEDDKFEGKGKFTYKNETVYEGDFKNGKFEGKGKISWKDGDTKEGAWRNDEFYTGTMKNKQDIVLEKWKDGKQIDLDTSEKGALRNYHISTYLTQQGFTQIEKGTFESKAKDLTFTIKGDVVDCTRSVGRVFGNWELSDLEQKWKKDLEKILKETKATPITSTATVSAPVPTVAPKASAPAPTVAVPPTPSATASTPSANKSETSL